MTVKHIITSGCSFSMSFLYNYPSEFVNSERSTWPIVLQQYCKKNNYDITFNNIGLESQGNDAIRRKAIYAVYNALKQGYKSEEILVLVMWSGLTRKSWYIDNPHMVNFLAEETHKNNYALNSNIFKKSYKNKFYRFPIFEIDVSDKEIDINNDSEYDSSSDVKKGWYVNDFNFNDCEFFKQYFSFSYHVGPVIYTLENILFLQDFCKNYNIKLFEQFFMDNVHTSLEMFKNHKECEYLYNLIDKSNRVSSQSIFDYLRSIETFEFQYLRSATDWHPSPEGHKIYTQNILIPFLKKHKIFD